MAQKWADHLIRTNQFDHSRNPHFGENLWSGSGSFKGRAVVDSWYSEEKYYNYKRSRYSPEAGHFTQLVWVASRKLGLGVARRNGKVVVVANYDPRGNVDSKERFKKNVLRPRF